MLSDDEPLTTALLASLTEAESLHQGGTGKEHGVFVHFSQASEFIRISSTSNESVSFQKDIYPIFERPHRHIAGFRADQRSAFFRDDGNGPLVLPGNSGESRLVAIVSGAMRRNASDHVLSAEKVALIKSWIDAGAQ